MTIEQSKTVHDARYRMEVGTSEGLPVEGEGVVQSAWLEFNSVRVEVSASQIDGTMYVMIDQAGEIRIDLNDATIWDGDAE